MASFAEWTEEQKKKKKKSAAGASFTEYTKQVLGRDDIESPLSERDDDIAPVRTTTKEEDDRKWFEKGAFEDGYQFGDVTKTILGSVTDIGENLGAGIIGLGEKAVDTLAFISPYVAQGQFYQNGGVYQPLEVQKTHEKMIQESKQGMSKFIAKDLYDEKKVAKTIISSPVKAVTGIDAEEDSVFGEKTDDLAQSGGQLLGTAALQAVGIPWFVTTGVASFGSETESALNQGASMEEAGLSAAISAGAEILTEKISGGIKFGGKALDDALTKEIARGVSNKVVRTLAKLGLDMAGEGAEEVLSGTMSAIGQKITYADDQELSDLFSSEDALESFIGGAVLGGVGGGVQAIKAGRNGVDYTSGLTQNEEAVVNKVYNDLVAEAEKSGKVTEKQKSKIYNEVLEQMDKGYISTDTIEEVLGGETYKTYKDTIDSEDALQAEFDALNKMKQGDMTGEQIDRRSELKQQLKDLENTSQRNLLKTQLSDEVFGLAKDSRLAESYNERARRSQAFEADLTQYDAKQKQTIQKAIDSGILNNTNRTHEFVDLISKISADKGVLFDFTNNQKLKDSGFAVDGKTVNGYVTKGGVTLNIDSSKSLNSVTGHEITHILEGTELYTELQNTLFEYAKSKGEYDSRLASLTELYKNVKDADVNAELTADLVGDYLFTDADFINRLSTENRNIFQKIYDEIKYLCNVATAGSKEARELERVKKVFEDAYRADSKASGDTKFSISETTDGRLAAVVDNDILSNIDASTWDKATKKQAQKAASEELKKFADGFTINGIEYVGNKPARDEYTRSNYTDALARKNPTAFLDKMRAAAVLDDVIQVATDWENDNGLKHSREDFVDFVRGKTLIKSGDRAYNATVLAGITSDGKAVFYDVEDIQPDSFDLKKMESSTAVSANELPNAILEDSNAPILAQKGKTVNGKFSLSDSDGRQLTKEQQEYFKDSKVRDDDGNLKVMYHGTPNGDYTIFKAGTYFTDNKEYADRYQNPGASSISTGKTATNPKTFEAYLNIKKPFDINDAEAKRIYIEDYIKGGNAIGINPYLSDAEYDKITTIDWTEGEDLRDFLIENGYDYDGLVLDEGADGGYGDEVKSRGTSYVVFSPEQVKNTDNLKPTADPDIRYSLSEKTEYADTFYSQMGKVVDGVKQDKLGAASVVSMLRGKGVKAEEIKWSGIEEWLDGKKSVTKEDLQEFIKGSQLQIEEETLDNREIPYTEEQNAKIAEYTEKHHDNMDKLIADWERIVGSEAPFAREATVDSADIDTLIRQAAADRAVDTTEGERFADLRDRAKAMIEENDNFGYDRVSQPYRSMLFNPESFIRNFDMSEENANLIREFAEAKQALENKKAEFVVSEQEIHRLKNRAEIAKSYARKISDVKSEHYAEQAKTGTKWGQYKLPGGENYREILFKIPGSEYYNQAMTTHWGNDHTGVLAHARLQDFNTPNGKMLFIEEIQSDWHNEGAKEGYADDESKGFADLTLGEYEMQANGIPIAEVTDAYGNTYAYVMKANGKYVVDLSNGRQFDSFLSEDDAISALKTNAQYDVGTPDAPFRKNYHEYVLKRLIRDAAEKGYDSIGWTTADTQSERWSHEYSEGYRIEYDQDIPKFLSKYGKKWGAKVDRGYVGTKKLTLEEEADLAFMEDMLDEDSIKEARGLVDMWSMPITDAMKQSVLYEGQPQYSISDNGQKHKQYGNYNVFAKDIMLDKGEVAPVEEIAPVSQTETAVETPETEQNVPITENVPLSPDGLAEIAKKARREEFRGAYTHNGKQYLSDGSFVAEFNTVDESLEQSKDFPAKRALKELDEAYERQISGNYNLHTSDTDGYVKVGDFLYDTKYVNALIRAIENPVFSLSNVRGGDNALLVSGDNGRALLMPVRAGDNVSVAYEAQPIGETAAEMFPDDLSPVQTELDKLNQQKETLERRMLESVNSEDLDNFYQINTEYESVMARIEELENEISETESDRVDSLTDADIPPEMEAPYYGSNKNASVENPFDDRDWYEVGNRKVKAYMYENPEVKPFFQREAMAMMGELADTTKGERFYDDQVYYASGGEKGITGVKRHTSASLEELLDSWHMSYADIEKGLTAIIEDNGAENIAAAKKLEFMLNDRLLNGYQDFYTNKRVPPNQDYINLLNEKQINEYSKEAFDSFMATADQYAPVAEDVAPVTSVTEENTATEDIAPVAEKYETIRPKPKKEPRMARVDKVQQNTESPQVAEVMYEEPQTAKRNSRVWSRFVANFGDKGNVFETLSLKTKNRELQARYNTIHYAEGKAQKLIGEGTTGVKSLSDIISEVEKTGKTKKFYEYLYHLHNVDRMSLEGRYKDMPNKAVFGDSVTADMSRMMATELAKENPEFRSWSQDVYRFNNYLRKLLVEGGVISQETADLWAEMYPHYVPIRRAGDDGLNINVPLDTRKTGVNAPIKKATGGSRDILPLFDTMAQRTLQTYKAIAKNRFGVELKNTLGTTIAKESTSVDGVIDSVDQQEGLLQEGKNGKAPTFTVFENGEKVTFEITEDMYDALKPTSEGLAYTNKVANTVSNFRRGLLTEYNPTFMLTNAIKDAQDVLFNSQHAIKTYAAFPKAIQQLATKGKWYTEYMENGGEQNTYFDNETNTFEKEKSGFVKVVGVPFEAISTANNFIERVPRLAEYIASRRSGRSIDVSMLDAARVTTNFAAGGDVTKLLNRNGATFLNASVQGFMQNVRNVREAKANGLKGAGVLAAKFAAAGLSGLLLNHLLWGDDEEYEELSDYVKQNYYIVGKYGDGQFVRIPKGRMMAVIQNAFEQMQNAITGDDEVDLQTFGELFLSNLAPNNPLDNNIISPIIQTATNKTWYGEDLVPTSLQDQPAGEQYDETTDSISKWLGEKLDVSPYKINYLLDQYSGGIGDTFLPMLTPAAERGDDSLAGNIIAPLKDKFTTDSVLKNQNVSDFYGLQEELTVNANASDATDDDVLKSKYINSVNSELNELYAQKREIQNSNKPDAEKYKLVRNIQSRIVELTREALNAYEDVRYENDEYAVIGDKYFQWYTPEEGDPYWRKLTDSQTTKYLVTSAAGDANYATDGNVHYRRDEDGEWTKISDKQLARQKEVTKALGITPEEYWSETEISFMPMSNGEYEYAYDNPENYAVAKAVGGYDSYKQYSSELYNIKADKDKNGKSINGSRKEKVAEYINNLDADYGTKIILFKSEYPSDDTYNSEIVEYLNGRDDISYEEMETILKKLGFTVSSDGTISWD